MARRTIRSAKSRRGCVVRIAATGALLTIMVGAVGAYLAGGLLVAPCPAEVSPPNDVLPIEDLRIPSASGGSLAAWFAQGSRDGRAVLLLHPLHANRRAMWGRALYYHRAGYGVLLVDFQAHGESPGEHLTFGYLESRDVQAALAYLRERLPAAKAVVHGWSLGAAAAMLADPPLDADAFVLESPYATIEEATRNRVRMYAGSWAAAVLTPMLVMQFKPRLGIPPEQLRPIVGLRRMDAPTLFMAGSADRRTPLDESRRIFDAAREPKALWVVEGAGHVNFQRLDPEAYRNRLFSFLDEHLGRSPEGGGD